MTLEIIECKILIPHKQDNKCKETVKSLIAEMFEIFMTIAFTLMFTYVLGMLPDRHGGITDVYIMFVIPGSVSPKTAAVRLFFK